MFALGEKTVNIRKHKIVCTHVVHGRTIYILPLNTAKFYSRSSDLGGQFNGTMWL